MTGSATCKPLHNERYRAHNDCVAVCPKKMQMSINHPNVHVVSLISLSWRSVLPYSSWMEQYMVHGLKSFGASALEHILNCVRPLTTNIFVLFITSKSPCVCFGGFSAGLHINYKRNYHKTSCRMGLWLGWIPLTLSVDLDKEMDPRIFLPTLWERVFFWHVPKFLSKWILLTLHPSSGLWRCVWTTVMRWSSRVLERHRQASSRVLATAPRLVFFSGSGREMAATCCVVMIPKSCFHTHWWVDWNVQHVLRLKTSFSFPSFSPCISCCSLVSLSNKGTIV